MGKRSLVKQITDELHSRDTHSKNPYKGEYGIDSEGTMKSYVKACVAFGGYCRANYGAKTIDECRQYIPAYMKSREDLSPYTLLSEIGTYPRMASTATISAGKRQPERERSRRLYT